MLKDLNFYYYTHKLGKLVRTNHLVDSYANASKIPVSEILIPKLCSRKRTIFELNNILENVADIYFRLEVLLCFYVEIFKKYCYGHFCFYCVCFVFLIILIVFNAYMCLPRIGSWCTTDLFPT